MEEFDFAVGPQNPNKEVPLEILVEAVSFLSALIGKIRSSLGRLMAADVSEYCFRDQKNPNPNYCMLQTFPSEEGTVKKEIGEYWRNWRRRLLSTPSSLTSSLFRSLLLVCSIKASSTSNVSTTK